MFEQIGAGQLMFCAIPKTSFHVWDCDECQKWHGELIIPITDEGMAIGVKRHELDDTDTLAEMMESIYQLTIASLQNGVSSEVAQLVEDMYGKDFYRLLQLYDAFSVWAERTEDNDD